MSLLLLCCLLWSMSCIDLCFCDSVCLMVLCAVTLESVANAIFFFIWACSTHIVGYKLLSKNMYACSLHNPTIVIGNLQTTLKRPNHI